MPHTKGEQDNPEDAHDVTCGQARHPGQLWGISLAMALISHTVNEDAAAGSACYIS